MNGGTGARSGALHVRPQKNELPFERTLRPPDTSSGHSGGHLLCPASGGSPLVTIAFAWDFHAVSASIRARTFERTLQPPETLSGHSADILTALSRAVFPVPARPHRPQQPPFIGFFRLFNVATLADAATAGRGERTFGGHFPDFLRRPSHEPIGRSGLCLQGFHATPPRLRLRTLPDISPSRNSLPRFLL